MAPTAHGTLHPVSNDREGRHRPYLVVEEYLDDHWREIAEAAREHDVKVAFSWDTRHFHAAVDDQGRDRVLAGPKRSDRRSFSCGND